MLDAAHMKQVEAMLEGEPERAVEAMEHWCDHSSVAPINYIAMIRFDAGRLGLTHDLSGTGEVPADATEEECARSSWPQITSVSRSSTSCSPVDAVDERWSRLALRLAAERGRIASVRHLLARGADRTPATPRDPGRWT